MHSSVGCIASAAVAVSRVGGGSAWGCLWGGGSARHPPCEQNDRQVALVEKYERYELYYAKKSNKIKYRGRKWYINSDNINYKRTNLEESFVNDYINQILKVNQNIIVSKNRRTKSQCIQMQNKRAFS